MVALTLNFYLFYTLFRERKVLKVSFLSNADEVGGVFIIVIIMSGRASVFHFWTIFRKPLIRLL